MNNAEHLELLAAAIEDAKDQGWEHDSIVALLDTAEGAVEAAQGIRRLVGMLADSPGGVPSPDPPTPPWRTGYRASAAHGLLVTSQPGKAITVDLDTGSRELALQAISIPKAKTLRDFLSEAIENAEHDRTEA